VKLVTTTAELDDALRPPAGTTRVGLVPTMGALHEGHEALLAAAREAADRVVVSIFVNPLQFGPSEDLATYPRTMEDDLERCAARGVDVVFAPATEMVYPDGLPKVTVDPGPLGEQWEGASRLGHFRGVLTVVTKLFGLVRPQLAVFGTKDYQQLTLVRRCVQDLCLPVQIHGVETVRDADGLALSSRNRYLSPDERSAALALSRALYAGRRAAPDGPDVVVSTAGRILDEAPGVSLDYLVLRGDDLGPVPESGSARLLVAARVGTTRLIDNMSVELGVRPTPESC
jgi:pantoate--beta-alanine ligase